MVVHDPWTWLLGRTPEGAWRHVPYQALEPGMGQAPALEPRVEVVRRLIAYPPRAFRTVLEQVAALDGPGRRVRWVCFRGPGVDPARPYWLCIVSATSPGRRFHFGLELFDRERLGLWILSGFDPIAAPVELLATFPSRADLRLPRLELTDATIDTLPLAAWLHEAWADRLRFSRQGLATPANLASSGSADASLVLDAQALAVSAAGGDGDAGAVAPRAARARLVACPLVETGGPGSSSEGGEGAALPGEVSLHALGKLIVVIGRDPRCDVVVVDRSVSNEHARLAWNDGVPSLEDLGSKNGTTVDGERLAPRTPRRLPNEARIELGAVPCLFVRDVDPPEPQRHTTKLAALVSRQSVSPAQADDALAEAARRGITPGEALLLSKSIALDDWAPRRGGGCAVFLAAALTLMLAGCHGFALPPLYEQDLDPAPMRDGDVQWDWDIGLRPLFQARASEEQGRVDGHLLFPLAFMERTPTSRTVRLYPLYQRIQRTDPDGFADDDTLLFPLMATGTHPVEGSYLYVFPFGGNLKGLLGKDEARGVLFPLYGWTRDRDTETHHVLWPLLSWTGGGGSSGVRVMPFYGHQQKHDEDGELVFDRTTVLWPLFSWAHDGTNSAAPTGARAPSGGSCATSRSPTRRPASCATRAARCSASTS